MQKKIRILMLIVIMIGATLSFIIFPMILPESNNIGSITAGLGLVLGFSLILASWYKASKKL
jgi:hypothetical protein